MNDIIKLKISCTDLASEWPLKYFSFANLNASFFIVSKKGKRKVQGVPQAQTGKS